MMRYLVRPPVATDRVHATVDGRVLIETPPDSHTGATTLVLDPLQWVRRMTNQIPDARMHLVRYYGAYANRSRSRYRDEDGEVGVPASGAEGSGGVNRAGRASWARLLKRVFDVDLACPRCGAQMAVLSFLTDPDVVDRVRAHVREEEVELLFDPRNRSGYETS